MLSSNSSNEEQRIECRNCHETEPAEFIAPCRCAGSIKYVHRQCLNDWRAFSPNPSSFTTCDVCHFPYVLKNEPGEKECASRLRFGLYITRDLLGVTLLFQAIVVLLAFFVHLIDSNKDRATFFPENWSLLSVDYVCGLLTFFFFLGIYGIIFSIYWCCSGSSSSSSSSRSYNYVTYDTYPYNWGFYYYWFWLPPGPGVGNVGCCPCCYSTAACPTGTCDNAHCGNLKCGDGDSSVYGIGLLIVLGLIITIGVIVGLVFLSILVSRIFHRHIHILRKVRDARKLVVADLEAEGIDPNTYVDNNGAYLSGVVVHSEVAPINEAMSIPETEKKSLLS
eukprot:TRINITY_DN3265_c0_g1_i4.p1 TRINITY_DN3265_c0_g1~~TRINITY_DN3265_c0_g1_i4.p1  ORF type:complete len:335 (+),score=43.65 TRINITY_DN3265_c0_g1_i4:733-1737(+)